MRRLSAAFIVALVGVSAWGQRLTAAYDKLWGGSLFDTFRDCAVDGSGNVYVIGNADLSAANRVSRVIKYGPTGNILWSKDLPITNPSTTTALELKGSVLVVTSGFSDGNLAKQFHARLNPSNGNLVWQQIQPDNLGGGFSIGTTTVVLAKKTSIDFFIGAACFDLNLGTKKWEVALGQANGGVDVETQPSGDFVMLSRPFTTGETVVQRRSNSDGGVIWERRYPGVNGSSMAVLKPSGNVVVGVRTNPRVEVLNGLTGETLRTDPLPVGNTAVFASLGDSYYVQTDDFSTRVQFRDAAGYLLGIVATQDDFSFGSIVDPSGQLIHADETFNFDTGVLDLRVARQLVGASEFFPIATPSRTFNLATAGAFIAVCGQTNVSTSNIQARVSLFRQPIDVRNDTFGYRKGQILNVGAPGFLSNDSGWQDASIEFTQPSNGSIVLNADKSFKYTPNVGFFGSETFTYTLRQGFANKTATVQLLPVTVSSVDIIPDSVVGGTNLTGVVRLTQPNPFHDLVIQLTENISGLAVTSSIAIPQGKDQATFNIITVPVATDQTGSITAKLDGVTSSDSLTVKRAVPDTLVLTPASLVGGLTFTGKVTMTGKAPVNGYVLAVTHSGTDVATPVTVTVPSGQDNITFTGTTSARSTPVTRLISVTSGGVTKAQNLDINPGGLFAFTINPTSVQGGTSANGKIQVAGLAPAGGTVVTMTKNGGNVSVPATVTVAEGTQFKNFTMPTSAVATTVVRTITATFGSIVKTGTLTITP